MSMKTPHDVNNLSEMQVKAFGAKLHDTDIFEGPETFVGKRNMKMENSFTENFTNRKHVRPNFSSSISCPEILTDESHSSYTHKRRYNSESTPFLGNSSDERLSVSLQEDKFRIGEDENGKGKSLFLRNWLQSLDEDGYQGNTSKGNLKSGCSKGDSSVTVHCASASHMNNKVLLEVDVDLFKSSNEPVEMCLPITTSKGTETAVITMKLVETTESDHSSQTRRNSLRLPSESGIGTLTGSLTSSRRSSSGSNCDRRLLDFRSEPPSPENSKGRHHLNFVRQMDLHADQNSFKFIGNLVIPSVTVSDFSELEHGDEDLGGTLAYDDKNKWLSVSSGLDPDSDESSLSCFDLSSTDDEMKEIKPQRKAVSRFLLSHDVILCFQLFFIFRVK
ncbi:hypothetical protein LOTGIDRAFT_156805 [Lottia gigantea]|uniref:Uncharacterized protein n=1 Tax=Lottia gigantea TaxID=225164 RepID=V4CKU4_LOTGI|nr:hypothetical protein LOTGIDRAFT_156805 [Lottia gigantea]ESP02855.1 hypothetical protein LOTGIDRAFT_156805 [Lottia gigantea]